LIAGGGVPYLLSLLGAGRRLRLLAAATAAELSEAGARGADAPLACAAGDPPAPPADERADCVGSVSFAAQRGLVLALRAPDSDVDEFLVAVDRESGALVFDGAAFACGDDFDVRVSVLGPEKHVVMQAGGRLWLTRFLLRHCACVFGHFAGAPTPLLHDRRVLPLPRFLPRAPARGVAQFSHALADAALVPSAAGACV
jgi:hypothetical protein